MKLSEAILLGSIGSEQGRGISSANPSNKQLCAIGAAMLAVGAEEGHPGSYYMRLVHTYWPWTGRRVEVPTRMRFYSGAIRIYSLIWLLNDTFQWTRPQIAAWVAEQEAIYDPDPQPVAKVDELVIQ